MHEAWRRLYSHNIVGWCYVMVGDAHPSSNEDCAGKREISFMFTHKHTHTHTLYFSLIWFLKFTITSSSPSHSLSLYHRAIIVPFKVIINCIIASPAPTEAPLSFCCLFYPLPLPIKPFEFESMGVKCPEAKRQIIRVYRLMSRRAVSLTLM